MKRKVVTKRRGGGREARSRTRVAGRKAALPERKTRGSPAAARARQVAAQKRREAIPPDEEPLTFIDTRPSPLDPEQAESPLVTEFSLAMERYKREHGRPFPAWSEVLHVLLGLGYRKVDPEG